MAWIRGELTREGVVTTTDAWLVHRLTGAFVTDAATAGRTQLLDLDRSSGSRAARHLRAGRRALPEIVGGGRSSAAPTFSAPTIPVTGLLVDQQAALLAQSVRPGTAKCTYGTGAFLLAQTGARPRAVDVAGWSAGWPGGCAGALATASTVRCTRRPPPCAGSPTSGWCPPPIRLDAVAADSSDGVLFVPALAGLAAPWWDSAATALVHRDEAVQRPRPTGPGAAGGHCRPSGRVGRPGRHRPGSATDPASGGRRAHPLRRAHAGPGRPRAHPRRRLPVAARHCARCRRVRSVGPRPEP